MPGHEPFRDARDLYRLRPGKIQPLKAPLRPGGEDAVPLPVVSHDEEAAAGLPLPYHGGREDDVARPRKILPVEDFALP